MVGVVSKTGKISRSRLEELSIKGLGVIDNATVEFSPGLNVLTGETGAGKTMVLTALSLVLGGKSDSDLVRAGYERLQVTGRFLLPDLPSAELKNLIEEFDPEIEENSILLGRSVTRDGKSRALLSGAPTTATALTSFGDELIEIHGQHGAISLLKEARQRELLDQFIGSSIIELLDIYRMNLSEYKSTQAKLKVLEKSKNDRESEISELESLTTDAKKLSPKPGELAEIDREIELLSRVEQIRISLNETLSALSDEESGSTNGLSMARRSLNLVADVDKRLAQINEVIEGAYFQVSDAVSEIASFLDSLTADPARLEAMQVRKSALRSFAKRFGRGASIEEQFETAIARAQSANERLRDISGGSERIIELENEISRRRNETFNLARKISDLRKKEADRLSMEVTEEIHQLSMPAAEFKVEVISNVDEDLIFNEWGIDRVEMLFSSHKGGAFLPISKSASGGELSRVMLALEVVVASRFPLGTYLFDEVDAGIGGKAALEVGKRLKKLAENAQVIVVTHLPQVAIWADRHLLVVKDSNGAITQSSISVLTGNELESEIARMLSGVDESEHAQEHARELLDLGKA
jgi:DNA repair protein RecN (Recombination protein N)